jgi:hypothetical protein
MKKPIGYIIRGREAIREGGFGELYDYIWAKNGVFIEAENTLISARIPVAVGVTRGLEEMKMAVTLKHGKIPQAYFDCILDEMQRSPEIESYYAIVWDEDRYKIRKPDLHQSSDKVIYDVLPNVVLDIHSHVPLVYTSETCPGKPCGSGCDHKWPAMVGFSTQDDKDELGLKIYGVIGLLGQQTPVALLRAGVYGYFYYIDWGDVFEGESTQHHCRVRWQFAPPDSIQEIAGNMIDYWKHLGNADID